MGGVGEKVGGGGGGRRGWGGVGSGWDVGGGAPQRLHEEDYCQLLRG